MTQLIGPEIIDFLTRDDDSVFIVNGKDDEIYFIDDPDIILKLSTITNKFPEAEALEIMLPMLNPEKYKR